MLVQTIASRPTRTRDTTFLIPLVFWRHIECHSQCSRGVHLSLILSPHNGQTPACNAIQFQRLGASSQLSQKGATRPKVGQRGCVASSLESRSPVTPAPLGLGCQREAAYIHVPSRWSLDFRPSPLPLASTLPSQVVLGLPAQASCKAAKVLDLLRFVSLQFLCGPPPLNLESVAPRQSTSGSLERFRTVAGRVQHVRGSVWRHSSGDPTRGAERRGTPGILPGELAEEEFVLGGPQHRQAPRSKASAGLHP